jgi:hypothetical protein
MSPYGVQRDRVCQAPVISSAWPPVASEARPCGPYPADLEDSLNTSSVSESRICQGASMTKVANSSGHQVIFRILASAYGGVSRKFGDERRFGSIQAAPLPLSNTKSSDCWAINVQRHQKPCLASLLLCKDQLLGSEEIK